MTVDAGRASVGGSVCGGQETGVPLGPIGSGCPARSILPAVALASKTSTFHSAASVGAVVTRVARVPERVQLQPRDGVGIRQVERRARRDRHGLPVEQHLPRPPLRLEKVDVPQVGECVRVLHVVARTPERVGPLLRVLVRPREAVRRRRVVRRQGASSAGA